ncbi:hypothetical protein JMUB4039_1363 [Leptotrichia trevisanii]|jgi:phage protein|uniref:YokE-like PH domain-containing protein n=1 Tax=Leptotrichia trevisanii TaxID=109328 RepID=A0A510K166_9FUSO|nr:PH domain-containing protein [Leptotrichia trevisanii]BBM45362.1 hypothetical protein JMUB3870_1481 [Leptotrichia trevisanii]BBM52487.1 hypothetical protein JMUB3935_1466 [Leptotrichia trevisanii]BBM57384.1 hypothetical protein JMUB4039_1363 [Leptotrichia trevisanii]
MRTLKDIKTMLAKCGAAIWGTKKEVKELPNIIGDDEIITYATSGVYDGHTWLVISTNKRIIFLDKGMLFGVNQIEVPLSKVNSIKYRKRFFLGEIEIWDGASMIKVTNILKRTLIPFVNAVNDSIEEFEKLQKPLNQSSVADEIIKFKKLMDEGVITQEEFSKKKNELLK